MPERLPFIPSTVPLTVTLHAPTVWQMSVAPLLFEKLTNEFHEYDPEANTSVAPSVAELRVDEIWADVVPAVQFQDCPEPVHAASARTAVPRTARPPIDRIRKIAFLISTAPN